MSTHNNDTDSQELLALQDRVLDTSLSFGEAVSHQIDMDTLCDMIVKQIGDIFGAETTVLFFCAEETGELYVKQSFGPVDESLLRKLKGATKAGNGSAYADDSSPADFELSRSDRVEKEQRIVAVPFDADKSSTQTGRYSWPAAAVPLVAERKVKGMVALTWPRSSARPSGADLRMLDVIAARVANAIDNAWLYGQLRQLNEELEQKVRERTAELEHSNRALAEALEELKQTQTQLVQNEKMASLGQLTAGVAHEINNPLAYSISNIALARERLAMLNVRLDLLSTRADMADAMGEEEKRRLGMGFIERLAGNEVYSDDVPGFLAEVRDLSDEQAVTLTQRFLGYVGVREEQESARNQVVTGVDRLLVRSRDGLDRVKNIVLDLRSFSRLDEASFLTVDIDEGIESTLSIVTHLAKDRLVTLNHEKGFTAPYACFSAKLNQVVLNLVTNAIQATPAGGTVTVTTQERADGPVIEVRDTGVGIPEEQLSRIFDPFFTTKPVGDGTGLGLSISYKIIEEHGGQIRVESAPGEGTLFEILLPPRTH